MITDVHFYGREQGDWLAVLDVISRANGYRTTRYAYDTHKVRGNTTSKKHFLVTSYRNTKSNKSPVIHVGHGYGCSSAVYDLGFFAVTAYGELHKKEYMNIGIPEDQIMVVGSPTSIQLSQYKHPSYKRAWLAGRGQDPDKKTVLYAPTGQHKKSSGIFANWGDDEYQLVYNMCDYIKNRLGANLIVRLHDRKKYTKDWLDKYRRAFDNFEVYTTYADEDPGQLLYCKYSDVLIGDRSSMNTEFYVQNKPVVHIDSDTFENTGDWDLADRAGVVTDDFSVMLEATAAYLKHPDRHSDLRNDIVSKYISYVGEDSREQIIKEFNRLTR